MSGNKRVRFFTSAVFHSRAMAWTIATLMVCGLVAGIAARGWAQEPAAQPRAEQHPSKIEWQVGPTTAKLGDIAEIQIPAGYRFTGKEGTQKLLQASENLVSGKELGLLEADDDTHWAMLFEFDERGYVKDDERDKLDAAALLKDLKEGTEDANAERSKRGWKPIHVAGWERQPFYDPQTHNLTWATLVRGDDPQDIGSVNHEIRILGRHGTMDVDLIAPPTEYATLTGTFNSLIAGFHYTEGNRYSDFAKGDKVAEYGLTALILGGGAAVALKTGLLAKLGVLLVKLWKLILVGIVAIGASLKKLFQKIREIFGKEEKIEDPNQQAASQGQ